MNKEKFSQLTSESPVCTTLKEVAPEVKRIVAKFYLQDRYELSFEDVQCLYEHRSDLYTMVSYFMSGNGARILKPFWWVEEGAVDVLANKTWERMALVEQELMLLSQKARQGIAMIFLKFEGKDSQKGWNLYGEALDADESVLSETMSSIRSLMSLSGIHLKNLEVETPHGETLIRFRVDSIPEIDIEQVRKDLISDLDALPEDLRGHNGVVCSGDELVSKIQRFDLLVEELDRMNGWRVCGVSEEGQLLIMENTVQPDYIGKNYSYVRNSIGHLVFQRQGQIADFKGDLLHVNEEGDYVMIQNGEVIPSSEVLLHHSIPNLSEFVQMGRVSPVMTEEFTWLDEGRASAHVNVASWCDEDGLCMAEVPADRELGQVGAYAVLRVRLG